MKYYSVLLLAALLCLASTYAIEGNWDSVDYNNTAISITALNTALNGRNNYKLEVIGCSLSNPFTILDSYMQLNNIKASNCSEGTPAQSNLTQNLQEKFFYFQIYYSELILVNVYGNKTLTFTRQKTDMKNYKLMGTFQNGEGNRLTITNQSIFLCENTVKIGYSGNSKDSIRLINNTQQGNCNSSGKLVQTLKNAEYYRMENPNILRVYDNDYKVILELNKLNNWNGTTPTFVVPAANTSNNTKANDSSVKGDNAVSTISSNNSTLKGDTLTENKTNNHSNSSDGNTTKSSSKGDPASISSDNSTSSNKSNSSSNAVQPTTSTTSNSSISSNSSNSSSPSGSSSNTSSRSNVSNSSVPTNISKPTSISNTTNSTSNASISENKSANSNSSSNISQNTSNNTPKASNSSNINASNSSNSSSVSRPSNSSISSNNASNTSVKSNQTSNQTTNPPQTVITGPANNNNYIPPKINQSSSILPAQNQTTKTNFTTQYMTKVNQLNPKTSNIKLNSGIAVGIWTPEFIMYNDQSTWPAKYAINLTTIAFIGCNTVALPINFNFSGNAVKVGNTVTSTRKACGSIDQPYIDLTKNASYYSVNSNGTGIRVSFFDANGKILYALFRNTTEKEKANLVFASTTQIEVKQDVTQTNPSTQDKTKINSNNNDITALAKSTTSNNIPQQPTAQSTALTAPSSPTIPTANIPSAPITPSSPAIPAVIIPVPQTVTNTPVKVPPPSKNSPNDQKLIQSSFLTGRYNALKIGTVALPQSLSMRVNYVFTPQYIFIVGTCNQYVYPYNLTAQGGQTKINVATAKVNEKSGCDPSDDNLYIQPLLKSTYIDAISTLQNDLTLYLKDSSKNPTISLQKYSNKNANK